MISHVINAGSALIEYGRAICSRTYGVSRSEYDSEVNKKAKMKKAFTALVLFCRKYQRQIEGKAMMYEGDSDPVLKITTKMSAEQRI